MEGSERLKFLLAEKATILEHVSRHKQQYEATATMTTQKQSTSPPSVSIYARIRPLLPKELENDLYSTISISSDATTVFVTKPERRWTGGYYGTRKYSVQKAFGADSKTSDIFDETVRPLIDSVLSHTTHTVVIMAYGQTGAGKTFTVTDFEQLCVKLLFEVSEQQYELSSYEIRQNQFYDLLSKPPLAACKLMANGKSVTSSRHNGDDAAQLLMEAKENRMTRSTVKNATSSRSHSIVSFEFSDKRCIMFVDLAGSERSVYASQNSRERLNESISVNESLSALKDCLRANLERATGDTKIQIPIRASRLTMVLRDALDGEGRAKVALFGHISPNVVDVEDSLNTLMYLSPLQALNTPNETDLTAQGSLSVSSWDRPRSMAWLKRNMPAALPSDRLLPEPCTIDHLLKEVDGKETFVKLLQDRCQMTPKLKLSIDSYYKKLALLRSKTDSEVIRQNPAIKLYLKEMQGSELGLNSSGQATRKIADPALQRHIENLEKAGS